MKQVCLQSSQIIQKILSNAIRIKQLKNGTNRKKKKTVTCKRYDHVLENPRELPNNCQNLPVK